jgi:hypothetical protein
MVRESGWLFRLEMVRGVKMVMGWGVNMARDRERGRRASERVKMGKQD